MPAESIKNINEYLAEIAPYYESAEYLAAADELRTIVANVRGKVIALDLENTLVTRDLLHHSDFELSSILPPFSEIFYIRRPLANELIDALEANNTVILWTACSRSLLHDILFTCDIPFPNRPIWTISREVNIDAMKRAGLLRWKERWLLWLSRWRRMGRLRFGDEKIPSVHGVDFLLDDQARAHQYYCVRRGRFRDAQKILPVEPFSVRNLDELRSHHLDRGLIAAAKSLAEVAGEDQGIAEENPE